MDELSLFENFIIAAAIEFVEVRALSFVPSTLKPIDAAFDILFENRIVFDRGHPRCMTEQEIREEELV